MEDIADMDTNSEFESMCHDMKQQAVSSQLSPRIAGNSNSTGELSIRSRHQVANDFQATSQEQALSHLQLQPMGKPQTSQQTKVQYTRSSPRHLLVLPDSEIDTTQGSYMDEGCTSEDQEDLFLDTSQDITLEVCQYTE